MSLLAYATIGAVWLILAWILWRDWFAPQLSDPPTPIDWGDALREYSKLRAALESLRPPDGDTWSLRAAPTCRCQFYQTGLLREQDGALWMRADGDETAITEALVALTMENEE
jgi:hypothetical protein